MIKIYTLCRFISRILVRLTNRVPSSRDEKGVGAVAYEGLKRGNMMIML